MYSSFQGSMYTCSLHINACRVCIKHTCFLGKRPRACMVTLTFRLNSTTMTETVYPIIQMWTGSIPGKRQCNYRITRCTLFACFRPSCYVSVKNIKKKIKYFKLVIISRNGIKSEVQIQVQKIMSSYTCSTHDIILCVYCVGRNHT
jgi:hypothetical protein